MSKTLSIQQRWQQIRDQIVIAEKMAANSQPTPSPSRASVHTNQSINSATQRVVATIAVSKRQTVDFIEQAYAAGARKFGESFVQEAIPKIQQLTNLTDIEWHFIGPIQSNKCKQIAENFNWVHSVERIKIANKLSQQRPSNKPPLNILIQVNISAEQSKSGINAEQMLPLAKQIMALPQLQLRGLMCIPQHPTAAKHASESFHRMHKLYNTLGYYCADDEGAKIDTLSMGMSQDFTDAILSGSNMVRIGTALFGSR